MPLVFTLLLNSLDAPDLRPRCPVFHGPTLFSFPPFLVWMTLSHRLTLDIVQYWIFSGRIISPPFGPLDGVKSKSGKFFAVKIASHRDRSPRPFLHTAPLSSMRPLDLADECRAALPAHGHRKKDHPACFSSRRLVFFVSRPSASFFPISLEPPPLSKGLFEMASSYSQPSLDRLQPLFCNLPIDIPLGRKRQCLRSPPGDRPA